MTNSYQITSNDNTATIDVTLNGVFIASDGKKYSNIIQSHNITPDLLTVNRNNNATYIVTSTGKLYDSILNHRYNSALNAVAKYRAEFNTVSKLSAIDLVRVSLLESGANTNVMSINGGKGDYQLTDTKIEQIFNITGLNIDPWDSLQSAWGVLILLDDIARYINIPFLMASNYTIKTSDWYMGYNIGASNLWTILSNVISNPDGVVASSILNTGDALSFVANNKNSTYKELSTAYNLYFNYQVGSDLL